MMFEFILPPRSTRTTVNCWNRFVFCAAVVASSSLLLVCQNQLLPGSRLKYTPLTWHTTHAAAPAPANNNDSLWKLRSWEQRWQAICVHVPRPHRSHYTFATPTKPTIAHFIQSAVQFVQQQKPQKKNRWITNNGIRMGRQTWRM